MTTGALQSGIPPLPQAANASGAASPFNEPDASGGAFADRLNDAMRDSRSPNATRNPAPVPPAANTAAQPPSRTIASRSTKSSAISPSAGAPVSQAPAANAAANSAGTPANPGSNATGAASAAAGDPGAQNTQTSNPTASTTIAAPSKSPSGETSQFAWLEDILPFAGALEHAVSGGAHGVPATVHNPKAMDSSTTVSTTAPAKGSSAVIDIVKALADAGSSQPDTGGIPFGAVTPPDSNASRDPSAGLPAGTVAASTNQPPQIAPRAERAIQSLENAGLSAASSSAANSTPLPSIIAKVNSPAPNAQTVTAHAPQPKIDSPAQAAARDANAMNASGSSQDSGSGVKQAAPSEGAKNGGRQDAGKSNNQQPGLPSATNAAAANAGNINQAAANSFNATVNPAVQPGAPSATQGSTTTASLTGGAGQPGAQVTVAEKVATAMQTQPNNGVVSAASLIESQGKTEMRVSMQTEAMGALQLHAVLDGGRVGASISVVNHEAHTLLTNELPSLQQALTDQNVRLDHLTVINTPMTSGGMGDSRGFQSADYNQQRHQNDFLYPGALGGAQSPSTSSQTTAQEEIRRRLSVRA